MFNSFAPHACKCCDRPVPVDEQPRHRRGHKVELERAAAKRRRDALKNLKTANRLRREARHAA